MVKIPAELSYPEAVLIEPLSCVYNAFEARRTVPGDTVLIIGAGPIGALHALLNKRAGGRVFVADLSAGNFEIASLVTGIFPLEKTVAAFEYAAAGLGMKALVAPDGL